MSLSSLSALVLLVAVAFAMYQEFKLPGWSLFPVGIIACAPVFPARLRDFTVLMARAIAPLCLGALAVLLYREVQQSDSYIVGTIAEHSGKNVRQMLFNAQFLTNYKEPFYTAMSTLFAIVVGLALVEGIEAFQDIRDNATLETYHLRSILHYLDYFENEQLLDARKQRVVEAKRKLTDLVRLYVREISRGRDYNSHKSEAQHILTRCQHAVFDLEPNDSDDRVARDQIMGLIEKVGLARQKRVSFHGERPPTYMMVALWLMCAALVLPFMAEPMCVVPEQASAAAQAGAAATSPPSAEVKDAASAIMPHCDKGYMPNPKRFSQYFMIFILVSFFSFLMLMLHDVGDTRDGFWRMELSEFDKLLEELEETRVQPLLQSVNGDRARGPGCALGKDAA